MINAVFLPLSLFVFHTKQRGGGGAEFTSAHDLYS